MFDILIDYKPVDMLCITILTPIPNKHVSIIALVERVSTAIIRFLLCVTCNVDWKCIHIFLYGLIPKTVEVLLL